MMCLLQRWHRRDGPGQVWDLQKEQQINERISPVLNVGRWEGVGWVAADRVAAGRGMWEKVHQLPPASGRARWPRCHCRRPRRPPAAAAGWEHRGDMAPWSGTRSGGGERGGLEDTGETY